MTMQMQATIDLYELAKRISEEFDVPVAKVRNLRPEIRYWQCEHDIDPVSMFYEADADDSLPPPAPPPTLDVRESQYRIQRHSGEGVFFFAAQCSDCGMVYFALHESLDPERIET